MRYFLIHALYQYDSYGTYSGSYAQTIKYQSENFPLKYEIQELMFGRSLSGEFRGVTGINEVTEKEFNTWD